MVDTNVRRSILLPSSELKMETFFLSETFVSTYFYNSTRHYNREDQYRLTCCRFLATPSGTWVRILFLTQTQTELEPNLNHNFEYQFAFLGRCFLSLFTWLPNCLYSLYVHWCQSNCSGQIMKHPLIKLFISCYILWYWCVLKKITLFL